MARFEDDEKYDMLYKIVLVGDAGVGKTNILRVFRMEQEGYDENQKPTIGVEFGTKTITHAQSHDRLKLQVWDTAGQERYRAITSSHYRRAAGAMIVFDVSNRKTWQNAKEVWLPDLLQSTGESTGFLSKIMIVENKIDLLPKHGQAPAASESFISKSEIERFCEDHKLLYARTTAKYNPMSKQWDGESIASAFERLAYEIYAKDPKREGSLDMSENITLQAGHGNSSGCSC